MSIFQCLPYEHRVVVAADSAVEVDGAVGGFTSKLIAVPHWPGMLAARGAAVLIPMLGSYAWTSPDFDDFIANFTANATQAMDQCGTAYPECRERLAEMSEFILAGWSPRAGGLRAFHAHKPADGRWALSEVWAAAYAPPPDASGRAPLEPRSVEDHVALARRQVERIRTESAGAAGGDLVIAALTRNAVNLEIVRSFA